MDLSPITFGIILSLNPRGEIQQILKLIWELHMVIKIQKYVLSIHGYIAVLEHQSYV